MRRALFALMLLTRASSMAWAEEPVYFADAGLKAAVEQELWIADPTPTDMLKLTSLNASWVGITDLTGLGYASNLQTLGVNNNQLTDISVVASLVNLCTLDVHDNGISDISAVSNLPYLDELTIRGNNIHDLSPLSGLTGLRILQASLNGISDLTPLAGLVNLQRLNLEDNQVSDLSPLFALHKLGSLRLRNNRIDDILPLAGKNSILFLDLHGNRISDVSPLAGMTTLPTLHLSQNEIGDISPLAGLSDVQFLVLRDNQIRDISALTGLTSLNHLDLRGNPLNADAYATHIPQITANNPGLWLAYDDASSAVHILSISSGQGGVVSLPGEGTFTYDHGTSVVVKAEADPRFTFSHWSGTYTSVENPVVLTMTRDHQIQANFAAVREAIYVDFGALGDPGPNDPNVSDPWEDGSSQHPFDSIQEAIDDADDGVSVFVRPGTYYESIDLLGKNVQLLGIDLDEPKSAAWPVLRGSPNGPVVTFVGGEGPSCLLRGFVITGGGGTPAGAIACYASSPTIANCLIVGNRATGLNAAAVYCADSNAVFVNCTIADNDAGELGAGVCLIRSDAAFTNCILWSNGASEILIDGESRPFISYSTVAGGWPGQGNIDADPLFARPGRWVDANEPDLAVAPDDPGAVWGEGDYHLKSQAGRYEPETKTWLQDETTSVCIDGGDPTAPVAQEPSPNGKTINMGGYGGTAEASKSHLSF